MNVDFEGPRISPAEFLLKRPKMEPPLVKRAARPPEPAWFRTSCYSSRVFRGSSPSLVASPKGEESTWQLYEASEGDRRFFSVKRGGAFRRFLPQISGRVDWVKKRKESYEGREGVEMKKTCFCYSLWLRINGLLSQE